MNKLGNWHIAPCVAGACALKWSRVIYWFSSVDRGTQCLAGLFALEVLTTTALYKFTYLLTPWPIQSKSNALNQPCVEPEPSIRTATNRKPFILFKI